MKILYTLLFLFVNNCLFAQNNLKPIEVNGVYHALKTEKGRLGDVSRVLIEYASKNGKSFLGMATCEKCFPVVYAYEEAVSKKFGKAVFKSSAGIVPVYIFRYDGNSFMVMAPELHEDEDKQYYNFYSKDSQKVKLMTKEKIEDAFTDLLEFIYN